MGRSRLTHPAFTGAVALLAVNDHVLKPLVGGWLTGKLSDVAGVFVVRGGCIALWRDYFDMDALRRGLADLG